MAASGVVVGWTGAATAPGFLTAIIAWGDITVAHHESRLMRVAPRKADKERV